MLHQPQGIPLEIRSAEKLPLVATVIAIAGETPFLALSPPREARISNVISTWNMTIASGGGIPLYNGGLLIEPYPYPNFFLSVPPQQNIIMFTLLCKHFPPIPSDHMRSHNRLKHTPTIIRAGQSGQIPKPTSGQHKIKGFVVIQKKHFLDLNDFTADVSDNIKEFFGSKVAFQLVSTSQIDSSNGSAKLSENALLQNWSSTHEGVLTGHSTYGIEFDWDSHFGNPGAFFITNSHAHEFFLKSLTLKVPSHVHFNCNSWVYPASTYNRGRVFFSNRSYLPAKCPPRLIKLRNEELRSLRGELDGMANIERKECDRVYAYDVYNDLGDPDNKCVDLRRPVLGGSQQFPYPRRGRTGRPRTKTDPATESRLPLLESLRIYVPRDERFGHLKFSDVLANGLKSVVQFVGHLKFSDVLANGLKSGVQFVVPELKSFFNTSKQFNSFEDIMKLYSDGIKLPDNPILDAAQNLIPIELIKEFLKTDDQKLHEFPLPRVVATDEFAWRKDEEFARQMLAGVDPVIIQRLQSFPPKSKLDPEMYGPQLSSITALHIEKNLDGLTVEQALDENKLFILDHHEAITPYVNRINTQSTKIYASRTILFLKKDGTLRPVAIELSLPPLYKGRESVRKVFTPADEGAQGALWQLAKAYVVVVDSGYHQLISHWLKTHAAMEPFAIATNRQLSVMHPVHKLLSPHFKDTMNINALARQILINAEGFLEKTVFPGKYAMEMSAVAYKDWRFDEQGLPADLLKRGMAMVDSSMPHGLKLMIEDYPYAVDGLEIWFAIESWVKEYLSLYYENDDAVKSDTELQAWWTEIRTVGHGDKKDETWWYSMESVDEVKKALTTIMWMASALHAAVNFGQYPYGGHMPNRPSLSKRLIPEEGTQEFSDLVEKQDLYFLGTINNQVETTLGMALVEILSRHTRDEVYLGQGATSEWNEDERVTEAFERYGAKLKEIEKNITERNQEADKLKNRSGPAKFPYTLLYPNTSDLSRQGGLTGKGIPNSVSI